jgi:hypothetical protein
VTVAKPPPPPPGGTPPGPNAPPPGAACPRLTGPVAPRSAVADAMSAAAGRSYRPTLSLNDNPPAITVRLLLVQGIGWEESGWQSTIESCDGGLGTMQVMTDTATWMNEKYGTNNDRASLTGNINIATGFLAWLTRYFGDKYFSGNYSLAGDPNKIVLLDMVISAYQAGYGKVDNAMAANLDLPNRWYVDTVEGFMTHTPWTWSRCSSASSPARPSAAAPSPACPTSSAVSFAGSVMIYLVTRRGFGGAGATCSALRDGAPLLPVTVGAVYTAKYPTN